MFVQCSLIYFLFLVKFGSLLTLDDYDLYDDWYVEDNEDTSSTSLPTTIPPTTTDDYEVKLFPKIDYEDFTNKISKSNVIDTSGYYSTPYNALRTVVVSSNQKVTTTATRPRDDTTTSSNTEQTLGTDRTTSIIVIAILGVVTIFSVYCFASVLTQRYGGKNSLSALCMDAVATITSRNSSNNERALTEMNNETEQHNEQATKTDTVNEANSKKVHQNEPAARSDEAADEISYEIQENNEQPTKANTVIEIDSEKAHQNKQAVKSDTAAIEIYNEAAHQNERDARSDEAAVKISNDTQDANTDEVNQIYNETEQVKKQNVKSDNAIAENNNKSANQDEEAAKFYEVAIEISCEKHIE